MPYGIEHKEVDQQQNVQKIQKELDKKTGIEELYTLGILYPEK